VTVDPTQLDIVLVIEVPEELEPLEVAKTKLWIRLADADGHHHLLSTPSALTITSSRSVTATKLFAVTRFGSCIRRCG
jgi:hypothetical protein